MYTKLVKSEILSKGVLSFNLRVILLLLSFTDHIQKCNASNPYEKEDFEQRDTDHSMFSSQILNYPGALNEEPSLFHIDSSLLVLPPAEDGTKNFENIQKMIKFFYDSKYRENIERRERKKQGDIEAYKNNLVTKSWESQVQLKNYLVNLYKQTTSLQEIIPQFQNACSMQRKLIKTLERENTRLQSCLGDSERKNNELQDHIDELEGKNRELEKRTITFWGWITSLFSR
jgi:hypothetical protein